MVDLFLQQFGLKDGTQRYVRTNQGGELANSAAFRTVIATHGYILETTDRTPHHRMAEGNDHTAPSPIWSDVCCTEPTLV
jgi:hypothetical protein